MAVRKGEPAILVTVEWPGHPDGVRWYDTTARGWVAAKPAPVPLPTVTVAPYPTWEFRSVEIGTIPSGSLVRVYLFDAAGMTASDPFELFEAVAEGPPRRYLAAARVY